MRFGNPDLLWLLALLPFLAWLGLFAQSRRRRALTRIGDDGLVRKLYPASIEAWRKRRLWIALLCLALLCISAARPQYGRIEQVIERAGVDMIVALDTSPSMLAQDVTPNRLEKAKESLKWLLRRMKGNRVGIVAFAGNAFLNCPMTLDLELADLVLESLDTSSIGVAGTDLGKAIRESIDAFERGGIGTPVLVLITDGEDNEGESIAAAKEAAEAGIVIHAIGIGTESGSPVPDNNQGYKETADGTKVNSRMNLATLTTIAQTTRGSAYAAGENPMGAVEAIARNIERMQKSEMMSKKLVIHQDRFGWFLAPALLGLFWLLLSRPEQYRAEAATINVEASNANS